MSAGSIKHIKFNTDLVKGIPDGQRRSKEFIFLAECQCCRDMHPITGIPTHAVRQMITYMEMAAGEGGVEIRRGLH